MKEKSFCSICSIAVESKVYLPVSSVSDQNFKNAFIVKAFSAWNKALERFKCHEDKYIISLFNCSRIEYYFNIFLSIFVLSYVSYFFGFHFATYFNFLKSIYRHMECNFL